MDRAGGFLLGAYRKGSLMVPWPNYVHMDSWSRHYDVSNDVIKTKRDAGLISIEDVQETVNAESNGHMTDDVVMRPYYIIVVTYKWTDPFIYYCSAATTYHQTRPLTVK